MTLLDDLWRKLGQAERAPQDGARLVATAYLEGKDGAKVARDHRGRSASADLDVKGLKLAIIEEEARIAGEIAEERGITPRIKIEPSATEELLRRRVNAAIDSTERVDQETADRLDYERRFEEAKAELDRQKWVHQCNVEAENHKKPLGAAWTDPTSTFVPDLTPDQEAVLKYGQPNRVLGREIGEPAILDTRNLVAGGV